MKFLKFLCLREIDLSALSSVASIFLGPVSWTNGDCDRVVRAQRSDMVCRTRDFFAVKAWRRGGMLRLWRCEGTTRSYIPCPNLYNHYLYVSSYPTTHATQQSHYTYTCNTTRTVESTKSPQVSLNLPTKMEYLSLNLPTKMEYPTQAKVVVLARRTILINQGNRSKLETPAKHAERLWDENVEKE
jgi:hypothetical protein